jgi:thiamine-monophosphate kinase
VKAEDRFVDRLRALLPASDTVLLGPGDDAALVRREAGLLAATTDLLVEGVDFFPGEDPERLGRRAAAVNLSDLAAMGAEPEFFLLSVAFAREKGEDYPLAIARGAIARAGEFGAHLVGGDLSAAAQTVVSVAFWGKPAALPLTRSGAAPGDLVYVSGHPGHAAAGLHLARQLAAFAAQGSRPTPRFPEIRLEDQKRLLDAFHDPVPRVALGAALSREGLATAAIDVSDGLGADAGRLARGSDARVVLERNLLPVSDALLSFGEMADLDPVELMLAGGDDYELLFTVRATAAARLGEHAAAAGTPVTRIGRIENGAGAALADGRSERDIADLGHDHLEEVR